jgi:hypothetical protein
MLAIVLTLIGIAVILNAKDARPMIKCVIGAAIVISVFPLVIESLVRLVSGSGIGTGQTPKFGAALVSFCAIVLVTLGLLAWRRRVERARSHELWVRRNGSPRARALPAPPSNSDGRGDS